jgi:drug/metabolite transporter (DMT)-like permease
LRRSAVLLTGVALACFAGNSLLCRLTLAERRLDATTFTVIRLASGALVLALLAQSRPPAPHAQGLAPWLSAAALFAYAAPFSYAYLRLGAAMGALILFGSVQVTMLGWGFLRGERASPVTWTGIGVAFAGLVALTVPGKTAPDALGGIAMAVAGVAWGIYSLRGRTSGDPLRSTAASFLRSLPLALLLLAIAGPLTGLHVSMRGAVLAVASGAVASGLGYSIWYAALRSLTATHAAVLQLLVPVLAAAGAVAWLGETLSARLVLASAAILGGVALTIWGRVKRAA